MPQHSPLLVPKPASRVQLGHTIQQPYVLLQGDMAVPAVLTPVTVPRQSSPLQQPVLAAVRSNSSSSTATAAVLASLRQRHDFASQGSPLLPLGQLPQQQPQQLLQQLPQQDSPVPVSASHRWALACSSSSKRQIYGKYVLSFQWVCMQTTQHAKQRL